MSDYLSGLAARSLLSTDGVLPRLASRFEPAPGANLFPHAPARRPDAWDGGLEDFAELAADNAPPVSRRRVTAPVAASMLSLEASPIRDPNGATGVDRLSTRRSPDVQVAVPIAPVAQPGPAYGHAEPPSLAASIQPPPGLRHGDSASASKPLVGESVRPPDRPRDTAEIPGLEQRIRSAVSDALAGEILQHARQDRPTPSRQEAAGEVQPAAPTLVIAQPQVAVAARPATVDAAAAGKPKAQQEPPPAPTIHVTIGRIEVRATPTPSSVSPSRSKPASTMSLDDYLRQKDGGSR